MKIDLSSDDLFGNEAAEDESDEVFNAYALERPEVQNFTNESARIRILRALKGEGKSAIIRLAKNKLAADPDRAVVISTVGGALAPVETPVSYDGWVRAWKATMLQLVASEIGARVGMAWSDDAISLVEEAETNGFKSRSIVSAIIDRLKLPEVPERERLKIPNYEKLLQRWKSDDTSVWLFVDDVDKNFRNDQFYKNRTASFFDACRELTRVIPQVRIRAAIRPNVWTILKLEYECLTHVEQYIDDIAWSDANILALVAERIRGYLKRTSQLGEVTLPSDPRAQERALVALVFADPMRWGGRDRPPHIVLDTLSRNRPRWLVELCRVSAKAAVRTGVQGILLAHLTGELEKFGQRRIEDTIAEHSCECPELREIIDAFSKQPAHYSTDELLKVIKKNWSCPRKTGPACDLSC